MRGTIAKKKIQKDLVESREVEARDSAQAEYLAPVRDGPGSRHLARVAGTPPLLPFPRRRRAGVTRSQRKESL